MVKSGQIVSDGPEWSIQSRIFKSVQFSQGWSRMFKASIVSKDWYVDHWLLVEVKSFREVKNYKVHLDLYFMVII